jgi:hypothetical protein
MAFDIDNKLIKPLQMNAKLKGALVEVWFSMKHCWDGEI